VSGELSNLGGLAPGEFAVTRSQSSGPTTTTSFLQALARAYARHGSEAGTSGSEWFAGPYDPAVPAVPTTPSALAPLIDSAAQQAGLPAGLLAALVQVESGFQPNAVSSAGAKGLTQLMDGTARRLGVTNPFDSWENLQGGARFLRSLLDRYHQNLPLALAAYNAGPGAVDAAGGAIPPYPETERYVRLVLGAYRRISAPGSGGVVSE
jgi:soluble lytic murein transglycosylase-like protein